MLATLSNCHPSDQITKHWSHNLKAEMNLDKLQLIATAAVSSSAKVQWLMWWNSSTLTREALRFPKNPFSDKEFESWLNKASFWSGVSISLLCKTCMCILWLWCCFSTFGSNAYGISVSTDLYYSSNL